ncbi:MAG: hypothetical protein ACI97H_001450, partial [Marinobacter psychrophilus]
ASQNGQAPTAAVIADAFKVCRIALIIQRKLCALRQNNSRD